jgi:iron complex outermembrane receptor protein
MSNVIQLNALNISENSGGQVGSGYELEAALDAARTVRLSTSFSHQRSRDDTSGQDAGNAPHDRLYLRTDWRFAYGWAVNAQINAVGERRRAPGDVRPPLAGYTTADLTLRTDKPGHGWNFAASARNLFNADAREPAAAALANDFPLAGRVLWLQADYKL